MGCLYQIKFDNGKSYIGITIKTASKRLATHLKNARGGANLMIHNALRKYPDNYTLNTLAISDDWAYLCLIEKKAIVNFKTKFPDGYNLTDGGGGVAGYLVTEDMRRKNSIAHIGKQYAKGSVRTKEERKNLSLVNLGNKNAAGNKSGLGRKKSKEEIIDIKMRCAIRWAKEQGRLFSYLPKI